MSSGKLRNAANSRHLFDASSAGMPNITLPGFTDLSTADVANMTLPFPTTMSLFIAVFAHITTSSSITVTPAIEL